MVRFLIRCAFALVILALTVQPFAAAARPLKSELEALLASHPEIQARAKDVESNREGVREAYSGYLPRLDAFGEYGPNYIDSPVTKQAGGGSWFEIKEVVGGRLSQRLFDGFATPADVKSARLGVSVAESTLIATRQNILFDGIEAYIEVLRQKQLVSLARGNEETIRRQLDLEDERVRRGAGIAVDVLQAKSRLQIAKERRVAFEGGFQDATARYLQVFGRAPDLDRMSLPEPPIGWLPASQDEAVQVASSENPAIAASTSAVEAAAEQRRRARADYYPTIEIVGTANREKDNDLVQGTREDAGIALAATWNLFDGFATSAAVNRAAVDYGARQDNHETVRRQVTEQARLAWNEYRTASERAELLTNAVVIAEEVFEARGKLREAGKETVINVLDAERELSEARINLTEAEGDVRVAAFGLMRSMGRLDAARLGLTAD